MTYLAIEQALNDRWPKVELRRVARIRRETNSRSEETLLALSAYTGVRPRPEDGGNQLPSEETITGYWVARPGDLVFNPMWALEGGVAVSKYRGALSTAYRVYDLGPAIAPRFAHYYFRSRPAIEQYRLMVRGLTTFDRSVSREDFEGMPMPLPPLDVQQAIADYLDTETARIDALVSKKQRMIGLLEERRKTFVSKAMTVGLDDQAVLARTESEFAPELPRDWDLQRLRNVVIRIIDTAHKTAPVVDGGPYLVVRTSNVKQGRLVFNDARYTDAQTWQEWTLRGVPQPGDVMFTREAPAGEACIVPEGLPLCIGQRMVLLQVDREKIYGEWLMHSIYSGPAQRFIELLSNSTTVAHLNMSDIPDIPVTVPPLAEQARILEVVRRHIEREDYMVSRLVEQVSLLQERRQALITAAV